VSFLKLLKATPFALVVTLALAGALGFSTPAWATLPANVLSDINAAAAGANAVTASERVVGQAVGDRSLQWIQARRAHDSSARSLSVVVASAIARHPHLTGEIVAAAIAAAPGARDAIAHHTARNYPGFAAVIYRAAGTAPQISQPAQPNAAPVVIQQRQVRPQVRLRSAATYRSTPPAYNPAYRTALGQSAARVMPSYQPAYQPAAQPTYRAGQIQRPAPTAKIIAARQPAQPVTDAESDAPFEEDGVNDPIEGFNRAVFAVNDALDTMIFRPLAALYGYLMPNPAKPAAQRFFANLTLPVVMINDLVQLDGTDAAVSAGRFVVNSTVGVLGLFDVAAGIGLEKHHADFGQSLHSWGVGAGPYIVLPLLGPGTLRDGFGKGVDGFIDPFRYVLNADLKTARMVGSALVGREALVFPLDELRSSSVDYYSALRAAYYQKRPEQLRKGRGGGAAEEKAVDDMFDDAE